MARPSVLDEPVPDTSLGANDRTSNLLSTINLIQYFQNRPLRVLLLLHLDCSVTVCSAKTVPLGRRCGGRKVSDRELWNLGCP